ncbi:tetratricopeptide repeat protein [Thermodesulfobacteriota bacterium]
MTIILAVWCILVLASTISWFIVLVKLFKENGIFHGILGFFCGIYLFIWGWIKHRELNLTIPMAILSAAWLIGIVMSAFIEHPWNLREGFISQQEEKIPVGAVLSANNEVIMYSITGCPYCAAKRAELDSHGISFTDYDINKDQEARTRLDQRIRETVKPGSKIALQAPIIDVNGTLLLANPPISEIKQYLRYAQATLLSSSEEAVSSKSAGKIPSPDDLKKADEWRQKALALSKDGKFSDPDRALEYFNKAIRLDPNNALIYNNRGILLKDLGRYEEAIEDHTQALNLDSNFAEAHNNRGVAHYMLGNYQEAIKDCARARQIEPKFSNAYFNLALAYYKLEDLRSMCHNFRKACNFGDCNGINWARENGFCR